MNISCDGSVLNHGSYQATAFERARIKQKITDWEAANAHNYIYIYICIMIITIILIVLIIIIMS